MSVFFKGVKNVQIKALSAGAFWKRSGGKAQRPV